METIASASESRDQFLQLLVTQLRYQDPLEPTKQEDFLAQLAQFSTLEGIEKLNSNLDNFLSSQLENQTEQNSFLVELQQFQNMASAASMVGKTIEFEVGSGETPDSVTSTEETASGVVEAVVIEDGLVSLRVDNELVPFHRVREIASTNLEEASPIGDDTPSETIEPAE